MTRFGPEAPPRSAWILPALRGIRYCGMLLLCAGVAAAADEAAPEAAPITPAAETLAPYDAAEDSETAALEAEPAFEGPDEAARIYRMKCMGCHTIGEGALSGPDLVHLPTYPRQTVVDGIWRMQQQVGPMTEDEVALLTELLMDGEAAQRLEAERDRVRMREAATLEEPDARKGEALYFGRTPFLNGGASCAACHQAGGRGGNLASSLEDAYTRLGRESLLSTTENPGFPIMRAIYEDRPVTRQEALHVTAYLEKVSESPAGPFSPPLHLAGIAGALGMMALLGRKRAVRAAGTRARLVETANRRDATPRECERGAR